MPKNKGNNTQMTMFYTNTKNMQKCCLCNYTGNEKALRLHAKISHKGEDINFIREKSEARCSFCFKKVDIKSLGSHRCR